MKKRFISACAAALIAVGPAAVLAASPTNAAEPISTGVAIGRVSAAGVPALSPFKFGSKAHSRWYAKNYMKTKYGWGQNQWTALRDIFDRESGWSHKVANHGSGAYGIPQALPGSKMASAGKDWRTNPETQIRWGLGYIKDRYGSPNNAWSFWRSHSWY